MNQQPSAEKYHYSEAEDGVFPYFFTTDLAQWQRMNKSALH